MLVAALALGACPVLAAAPANSCSRALGTPAGAARHLKTLGKEPSQVGLALAPGHTWLLEVDEQGNDALVEVVDANNQPIARADHPEPRTGTRRAVVSSPDPGSLEVRVTGKEHANARGTATLRAFDLAALEARPECLAIMQSLAAADADYAAGKEISSGRAATPGASARDTFLRSLGAYAAAERALTAPGDRQLRGEVQLALAGINYYGLQDWAKAADWARAAAETLAPSDPYRHARAEALQAAAWTEIGRAAPSAPGSALPSSDLLMRARVAFQRLSRFHSRRGETYDAALMLNYLAVADLYKSRFDDCVAASTVSSGLFEKLRESPHLAQAWNNRAVCLWGLGRVAEARRWFERAAQSDTDPEADALLYLGVTNNTALLSYALGRFDESLQLFDRALAFEQRTQRHREEAQSLYGIGVTYYALGDRERARRFLERSLAMRTAALDRRGRVNTLRALATIDADEGRVEEATAFDREALGLAVEPTYIQRISIQLAVHTAASGHLEDAKTQLDQVIAAAGPDPLIGAEALLRRGVLLRQMGQLRTALADLSAARPRLEGLGSVSEEFAATLELARTLRLAGEPRAALKAVDEALRQADAVRLQSADPSLRSGLEAPLRSAYDLRVELLRARFEAASAAGRKAEADTLAAAAFSTADASRAHTLADLAARQYSPAVRRALAAELRRREALYEDLAGRRYALEDRWGRAGSSDERARRMLAEIAELERQVDTVNARIAARASVEAGHRRAGGNSPGPVRPLPGTALVSYWLGSESAYAWVVLPNAIHWTRLTGPAAISERAMAFYRSLTRLVDVPVEARLQAGVALYQAILEPLEPWLGDVRPWLIVPDGALDYVPFAALLPAAGQSPRYVVMKHDIALTPAAWMLDARTNRPASPHHRALLLVADPVYQADDPRLAAVRAVAASPPAAARGAPDAARADLRRLPFTAREAAAIAAQFPRAEVDELTALSATRERLLSLDWSRYRFIHIATHGTVDAQVPELSALMLGTYDARGSAVDGAVRVADLSTRSLDADVAVFSACETALGKEVPSEGLMGIGSTVLARGARAVVASLWPVPDASGAELMTEFYRHLLQDSMSPAAALSASMRSVVSRDPAADPALWAAFQVTTTRPWLEARSLATRPRP